MAYDGLELIDVGPLDDLNTGRTLGPYYDQPPQVNPYGIGSSTVSTPPADQFDTLQTLNNQPIISPKFHQDQLYSLPHGQNETGGFTFNQYDAAQQQAGASHGIPSDLARTTLPPGMILSGSATTPPSVSLLPGTTPDQFQTQAQAHGATGVSMERKCRVGKLRTRCHYTCGCRETYYQRRSEDGLCSKCRKNKSGACAVTQAAVPTGNVLAFKQNLTGGNGVDAHDHAPSISTDYRVQTGLQRQIGPSPRIYGQDGAALNIYDLHELQDEGQRTGIFGEDGMTPPPWSKQNATRPSAGHGALQSLTSPGRGLSTTLTAMQPDAASQSGNVRTVQPGPAVTGLTTAAAATNTPSAQAAAAPEEDDTSAWKHVFEDAGAAKQHLYGDDSDEKILFPLENDSVDEVKQKELEGELSQMMFDSLLHEPAAPPQHWTEDEKAKYLEGQRWAMEWIKRHLQSEEDVANACARVKLVVHSAVDQHENGIPRNQLKPRLRTTKSGFSLEAGLKCLDRVRIMIDAVRDHKYVAKDVLTIDNLVDLARAPAAYLDRKLSNRKSNHQKTVDAKAGQDLRKQGGLGDGDTAEESMKEGKHEAFASSLRERIRATEATHSEEDAIHPQQATMQSNREAPPAQADIGNATIAKTAPGQSFAAQGPNVYQESASSAIDPRLEMVAPAQQEELTPPHFNMLGKRKRSTDDAGSGKDAPKHQRTATNSTSFDGTIAHASSTEPDAGANASADE